MNLRIGTEVVIDRPVDEVFGFVAADHLENHPRWDPAVVRIIPRSVGALRLGSQMEIVRRTLGREESRLFEVTEWVDASRMAITTRAADFELTLASTFDALAAGGTRLTLSGDAVIGGPRAVLAPIMKLKFGADVRRNLARIKQLIEGAPSPAPMTARTSA